MQGTCMASIILRIIGSQIYAKNNRYTYNQGRINPPKAGRGHATLILLYRG